MGTREAVSSFAAALERFYEYAIEVLLTDAGIDQDQYVKTWKMVSSQSERQLGGFYLSWLLKFREPPEPLTTKRVEFRNNATHKGNIPSYEATHEYASFIFQYIIKHLKMLKDSCTQQSLFKASTRSQGAGLKLGEAVMSMPSMVSPALADEVLFNRTFDDALQDLQQRLGITFIKGK